MSNHPIEENNIDSNIQDTIPNTTSSIGEVGTELLPASFERHKIFYNKLVGTEEALSGVIEMINAKEIQPHERITMRAVVKKQVVAQNFAYLKNTDLIEGIIDLDGCGIEELEDCVILYLGKNGEERKRSNAENAETLAQEGSELMKQFKYTPSVETEKYKVIKLINGHIADEHLSLFPNNNQVTGRIVEEYSSLLKTFGWNDEDIKNLISTSTIHLCIDFDTLSNITGEGILVAGAGIAEQGPVEIILEDGTVVIIDIAELTEAVVHPSARGFNIYHMLTEMQLKELAKKIKPPHIVYGESNLDPKSRGVLVTAARNGRGPANSFEYNGVRYSIEHACLNAHVPVGEDTSAHSDFLPTAITLAKLLRLYANAQ